MRKRLIGVLAFALAVSAGAAFVLYQLISSRMTVGASNTKPTTIKVWVASKDLEVGSLVTDRELRTQEYLSVPPGALTKKEDIVNRGVTAPIHEDSPFYETNLAPKGAGAGFAATIPPGMRAFTVKVNEVIGVAGFAVAGMHVDILVSGQPPGGNGEGATVGNITRTLLQDIQVLSAGQNYQKDAEGKPVVVQVLNLLVTPDQAEILTLAAQQTIQLVLRNPADRTVVSTPGASTLGLFAGGKIRAPRLDVDSDKAEPRAPAPPPVAPPPPPPAKPRTVAVEIFNGPTKSVSTFVDPNAAPGSHPVQEAQQ